MTYEFIQVEREDALVTIRLNRPAAFNAMHVPLLRELCTAVIDVDVDPGVRGLLITGNGSSFSGGGDVKGFVAAGDDVPKVVHNMTLYFHSMVSRMIRMPKPVVMAINGMAAGGGISLAISGDIVLAAESAKFTSAYSRIAASPDGSSTFFLARVVGIRRALELVYTNRVLSAREAMDWGLVNRVVPDADLAREAKALAVQLSQGPTLALGKAKDLIYHSQNHDLEAQMERETQSIVACTKTEDFRGAIHAFVEKRPAHYQGR